MSFGRERSLRVTFFRRERMRSSEYSIGHPQVDGRRYVRFSYVLDSGDMQVTERLLEEKADLDSIRDRIAGELEAELAYAQTQDQVRAAAEAKLDAVLDAAVSKGELATDDLAVLGLKQASARAERTDELEVRR